MNVIWTILMILLLAVAGIISFPVTDVDYIKNQRQSQVPEVVSPPSSAIRPVFWTLSPEYNDTIHNDSHWDAFVAKLIREEAKGPTDAELAAERDAVLHGVNPNLLPWQVNSQRWGFNETSIPIEVYRKTVLLPYLQNHNDTSPNATEVPADYRNQLVVVNELDIDHHHILTHREFTRLCNQNGNHLSHENCDYKKLVCEKICNYKIWYPEYQKDPDLLTRKIFFDPHREILIEIYGLEKRIPTPRPLTWVPPELVDPDIDGTDGEDVQILLGGGGR